jgi:ribosomal protein L37E
LTSNATDRATEAAMLAAGIPPTHVCTLCGHVGFEHDLIGCLRCGFDEMRRLAGANADEGKVG